MAPVAQRGKQAANTLEHDLDAKLILDGLAVIAAGATAGAVNAAAGGGSLITFPTLVALGVSPLSANVTNTVGLLPGTVGGLLGYADALSEQRQRAARLAIPSLVGAAAGTVLLLLTPGNTFEAIVPALVALSSLLLLFQPLIAARRSHTRQNRTTLAVGLTLSGMYAAYFGSAVGILVTALLTLFVPDEVHRLNALKILLVGLMNLLPAVAYVFLAPVHAEYAAELMVSSLAGGRAGAFLARRMPSDVLRVAIACTGLVLAVVFAMRAFG
jgi:uncharacterized protein